MKTPPNPLDYEWTADGDLQYQQDLMRWQQEQKESANQPATNDKE
jgi:hypothetical protein